MRISRLRVGIDASSARQDARPMVEATRDIEAGSREATRQVDRLETEVRQAGATSRRSGRDVRQLGDSTERAGRSADRAGQNLERTNKRLRNTGAGARAARTALVGLVATFSALSVARGAVSTIVDFQDAQSTLAAVTRTSGDQLAIFEEQARSLGATTRFSATEAGNAQVFLARAGFESQQILAAVPGTLDLAAAGAIGLGEAADIASNVLSQFNLEAEKTGLVGDILVNTANSANTDVRQLAEALKLAGPVAGALGISLETTSSALGVLGDSGVQASLAGTNLRGVLSALLGPTTKAEGALTRMGLSAAELNPTTNGLVDILRKLQGAQLTAADAVDIFGRRNAAAALILTQSVDKVEALAKANEKAEGTAREAAKVMNDNLGGSLKALGSAFQEAALSGGDAGFAGGLRAVVDAGTGAIRILLGIADEATLADGAAQVLARALTAVAIAAAGLVALKLIAWLAGIASAAKAAAFGVNALNVAMTATPWGALAKAAVIAGAAIIAFTRDLDEPRRELSELDKSIQSTTKSIEALRKAFDRGIEVKSIEDQIASTRKQIDLLKKASVEIRTAAEESVPIGGLSGLIDNFSSSNFKDVFVNNDFDIIGIGRVEALKALESEIKRLSEVEKQLSDQRSADGKKSAEQIRQEVSRAVAVDESREALERMVLQVREEGRALAGSSAGFENLEKAVQAVALAKQAGLVEGTKLLAQLGIEAARNKIVAASIDLVTQAEERRREAQQREAEARSGLESLLSGLRQETELLRLSTDEREVQTRIIEAQKIAAEGGLALTREQTSEIRTQIEAQQQLRAEEAARRAAERETRVPATRTTGGGAGFSVGRQDPTTQIGDLFRPLREESELIGLSNVERQKAINLREIERLATQAQIEDVQGLVNAYADEFDALVRAQQLTDVARDVGREFGSAFATAISGAESLGDAVGNLVSRLQSLALDEFLIKPFEQLFGSLAGGLFGGSSSFGVPGGQIGPALPPGFPNATGNAYSAGNVIPFASGTVVNEPTYFPMSGGRTGLMGEKGEEGILPLQRDSRGRLGVSAVGGGQSTTVVNQSIVIQTPNPNAMRKSSRHIMEDANRAFRGAR